jgi:hypothetical protein
MVRYRPKERAAIYTRVSTGSQTTENQLRELRQVAERLGHQVVAEFTDEGISGAKGRDQRPGLNKLLEGVTRRDFDKVMAWSVDRLGRSLPDLLAVMGELKAKAVCQPSFLAHNVLNSGRLLIVSSASKRALHTSHTKAVLLFCLSMLMTRLRS